MSARILGPLLVALAAGPAHAATEVNAFVQPERRDEEGVVTVEAAAIHVIRCDDPGENGRTFYIYQYIYRDGFRAIEPPAWGEAIGGHDWDTYAEAVEAACAVEGAPRAEPGVEVERET